ncbi:MAG: hypothetical protein KVP17_003086 [Porospora cf. gigantea B]|uniref:uncharacterized protein n=1 Tax=Porospora cf. gigantea B TaxID=2853592 RepID=UPI003571957E|nr:MAG: hypothetical protein KVP17_003086 [Porospora cf. gigantea B]
MTEESHKRLFPEVDDVPNEDVSVTVHNLTKLSSKLRELLEESQDAVLTSRKANLKCHNELETMRLSAMRQSTDLITMKERLEASENSCQGLREQLECANSHIKQLQAGERKSRSLRDSAGVEVSLAMREKEDGLEELRRQLFHEQDMVRLKEEQIVKVRSEREDSIRLLQNQVAADENQLRHYERLTNGLREQLKERHDVEKKLRKEINDLHATHSELECDLLSTRNDLQIAQSIKRPKLSDNDSPYVPINASDVKTILEEACSADVTDEATALLHELDAKTFALAKCRQKLAEKHLELDGSMAKVESLTVETTELRREFIRLDDSNQKLADSVESLKADVASKEGDLIDLQCKNQTLIRSMHPVRAQNKEMCNQLAVSNVTCEALLEMLTNTQVPESGECRQMSFRLMCRSN